MSVPNIPSELFTAFNDVTYYDEPHKYYYKDQQLTSVTTLIHRYEEEFDEEFWSEKKSREWNVPQDEVKYGWKFINERATTKGSIIHDYAENLFLNKVFPYPKLDVENRFSYDAVWDEYVITKKHVDEFYKLVHNILIPIRTELIVYDLEYLIGGMVDLLFYNKKSRDFEIWDWKTNKEFTFENERGDNLTGKLYMLEDCDLEKYSLQLSSYKYIIEKNTGIKLGQSHLVWLSYLNENYEVIKAKDREFYVKEMFEDHKIYNLLEN